MGSTERRAPTRRERDLGRLVARLLCAVFALIGALPLLGGLLVRSPPVLRWAASETSRVLHEQLGVTAHYQVEMRLWPLSVALLDLEVPASDGGAPALVADRIAVTPRVFALLAGRLDVGDIEIERPRARIVIRDGKLANVAYRLPESKGPKTELKRAPFASLGVTDARVDLDLDGVLVSTGPVDLDVFAESGPTFEVAVRAGESRIDRRRPLTLSADAKSTKSNEVDSAAERSITFDVHDEDVLCRVDLRARLSKQEILVRRLSLLGAADADPMPRTRPGCDSLKEDAEGRVALRVSQLRVAPRKGDLPLVDGHLFVRAPVRLTNRFVKTLPLSGWIGFSGDVRYDGTATLPELRGKLRGKDLQFDVYRLAKHLDADVEMTSDRILVPRFEMGFAEGRVVLTGGSISLLEPGMPITAKQVDSQDIQFAAMMRDLGVTPNTIVDWELVKTRVSKVSGTLSPLKIDGDMWGESRDFAVYDRAHHSPAKKRMIGVRAATVRGRIGVRPKALEFYDTRASFGKSSVLAPLVSIGFQNDLTLAIGKGSKIELGDVSPLVDIPWSGTAEISAKMSGKANKAVLTGDLAVAKLEFGGFPIGEIKSAKIRFQPLKLDFLDVVGKKGRSNFNVPTARLDFEAGSSVLVDARVQSDDFDVRDFFAMFHFDGDPRFEPIHGQGKVDAQVQYDLGGKRDRCGGGYLRVDGKLDLRRVELYEERYDSARADFDFRWLDRDASYLGVELDVPSMTLSKGAGSMLASLTMRRGGEVNGHLVATAVPLSKLDALGALGAGLDGRVSGVGEISGSVDALAVASSVRVSPVRIGGSTLPASEIALRLEPKRRALKVVGKTRCGAPITPPFDRNQYDRDEPDGTFKVSGRVFGKQIELGGLEISRQRKKRVRGNVAFADLDVGALAELVPEVALSSSRPNGVVSGKLRIDELAMDDPAAARAKLELSELSIERAGSRVELLEGADPITIEGRRLSFPELSLAVRTPSGQRAVFDMHGSVARLGAGSDVDATLQLRPMQLATLASFIPRAERASGTLKGSLHVTGPAQRLSYQGGFRLENGEIFVRGLPSPVSDLQIALAVDSGELRITRASAKVGSGTISITGSAPLRGFQLGAARVVVRAKQLAVPLDQGIRATVDANLVASWKPPSDSGEARSLPRVTGDIALRSFEYTRPVTMTADITSLAQRGKRTEFESYDPADDFVEFDVTMRSNRALKISNNLIEAELTFEKKGLLLAGTNQRFGLRGDVRIKQGGRIRMRQSEFEIRQGHVRFDDLTRIAPLVDVTAVTEYRRYSESESREGPATSTTAGGTGTAAGGGRWLITMHAHGDADKLRIDLTSDPALAQDDIFLLLTVGLTRAELDQSQSASVGESVALEALGTLSGADRAVTKAVPVIDEFRFGSAYSSRTGRTEPTVTIGKRLAERIRANVTSGVAESREIRSNLEWRLSPRVSVEGSYDNVNDISSSQLGNLGADIRWRLEFE